MLADLEHQQWIHWTRYMLNNLTPENIKRWKKQIDTPYNKLSEKEKESDREWAEKVLDNVPIKCPLWQCGGIMEARERKPNKEFEGDDQDSESWQFPDLVCVNCGVRYRFGGFL